MPERVARAPTCASLPPSLSPGGTPAGRIARHAGAAPCCAHPYMAHPHTCTGITSQASHPNPCMVLSPAAPTMPPCASCAPSAQRHAPLPHCAASHAMQAQAISANHALTCSPHARARPPPWRSHADRQVALAAWASGVQWRAQMVGACIHAVGVVTLGHPRNLPAPGPPARHRLCCFPSSSCDTAVLWASHGTCCSQVTAHERCRWQAFQSPGSKCCFYWAIIILRQ